jgi:hypothetical protein
MNPEDIANHIHNQIDYDLFDAIRSSLQTEIRFPLNNLHSSVYYNVRRNVVEKMDIGIDECIDFVFKYMRDTLYESRYSISF